MAQDQHLNPHLEERARSLSSRPMPIQRLAAVALVAISIGTGIGVDRVLLTPDQVGAQTEPDLTDAENFSVLLETFDVIRESYVRSDDISDDELIYGAAAGMVDALGDTGHSRFLSPEDAQRFAENTSGELVGIGVNIDTTAVPLRVIMPIQNSPALDAGVKAGDLIVSINGEDITKFEDPQDAVVLIRGEEGTDITIQVQREGVPDPIEMTMTRARITIEPVSWAMLPNDVLWVRIDQFSTGATDGLVTALQQGKELGARGLILDLRANPGGLVSEAMGVAQQLQPGGSVLYQEEDSTGAIVEQLVPEGDGEWQDLPIVVLIDGDSASAAEIVSSSLADNGRATLVGETTTGTGTVLMPTQLTDGSMVLIGTELWLTANGEVIWHHGVDPTIEVELDDDTLIDLPFAFETGQVTAEDLAATDDIQLTTALDELLKEIEPTS